MKKEKQIELLEVFFGRIGFLLGKGCGGDVYLDDIRNGNQRNQEECNFIWRFLKAYALTYPERSNIVGEMNFSEEGNTKLMRIKKLDFAITKERIPDLLNEIEKRREPGSAHNSGGFAPSV